MKTLFAISLAAAVVGVSGTASAVPLSGCTLNSGTATQTCNLYESDPNASPSEVSSANNIFGPDWAPGYFQIFDPNPVLAPVLSDVVVFTGGTATLYSFDDGGAAPPGFPGFGSIGTELGSASEDVTGFATFTEGPFIDTINVFSPANAVPEPITLSLFGAGLIGAAAMRRRKAK